MQPNEHPNKQTNNKQTTSQPGGKPADKRTYGQRNCDGLPETNLGQVSSEDEDNLQNL